MFYASHLILLFRVKVVLHVEKGLISSTER